jgi:hypothetical protein
VFQSELNSFRGDGVVLCVCAWGRERGGEHIFHWEMCKRVRDVFICVCISYVLWERNNIRSCLPVGAVSNQCMAHIK